MIVTAVEFEPDEMEELIEKIHFIATKEPMTFLRCGFTFQVTCKDLEFMESLILEVYIRMTEETTDYYPPEVGVRLYQDVDELKITLCNHLEEEIKSNLDWTFYEKLKLELNIIKE